MYDLSIFIGRFQPFHVGHLTVIQEGLKQSKNILVLVGSASSPRSHRNPFTYVERNNMIRSSLTPEESARVAIMPLEDSAYNETDWINRVHQQAANAVIELGITTNPEIALIGHSKDASSYYLRMFPTWDSIEAPNYNNVNSTQLRNSYFSNIGHMWVKDCDGHNPGDKTTQKIVTSSVKEFLDRFIDTSDFKKILAEYDHITEYKASWASAPWPVTFVTVDAVVVQSGHVLLVKRRSAPGKGLWAMPGGFIDQDERILDAMLRELRQETKIDVPDKVLKGSITAKDVFDDPNRSARGRTITHAFLIQLEDRETLPKVKGSDDAEKAKWVLIKTLNRKDFFEDHYDIIMNMIARAKNADSR